MPYKTEQFTEMSDEEQSEFYYLEEQVVLILFEIILFSKLILLIFEIDFILLAVARSKQQSFAV